MLKWVNTSYFRKRLVQIGKIFGYFNIFKRSRVTPYDKIRNRSENGRYTLSNRGDVACSDNTCHDIVPRLIAFFTQRKDVCTLFPPSKTQGMDVFFGERVFCGILFPTERAIRCASKPFLPLGFAPIFTRRFFCRAREEAFRLLNIDRIF